jgi:hypothetical protein
LVVLVRCRIARWSAPESLDDQRIEIDHREVILEHILHALARNARGQRRNSGECGRLRHLEYLKYVHKLARPGREVFQVCNCRAEAGRSPGNNLDGDDSKGKAN